jgi:hypothetical protein
MSKLLEHIIRNVLFEDNHDDPLTKDSFDSRYGHDDLGETKALTQLFYADSNLKKLAKKLKSKSEFFVQLTYEAKKIIPLRLADVIEDAIATSFVGNALIAPFTNGEYIFIVANPSLASVQKVPIIVLEKEHFEELQVDKHDVEQVEVPYRIKRVEDLDSDLYAEWIKWANEDAKLANNEIHWSNDQKQWDKFLNDPLNDTYGPDEKSTFVYLYNMYDDAFRRHMNPQALIPVTVGIPFTNKAGSSMIISKDTAMKRIKNKRAKNILSQIVTSGSQIANMTFAEQNQIVAILKFKDKESIKFINKFLRLKKVKTIQRLSADDKKELMIALRNLNK